jgi:hypothetical protein
LGTLEAGQLLVLNALNLNPVCGSAACLIMRAGDLLLIGIGAGMSLILFLRGSSPKTPVDRCETR